MGSAFRGRIRRCNFPKNPKTGGNPTKENIDTNTEMERIGEKKEMESKNSYFPEEDKSTKTGKRKKEIKTADVGKKYTQHHWATIRNCNQF